MKRKLELLALALVLAPAAVAQDYLPPAELVDMALSTHPHVLAAQARLSASQGEARRLAADPYDWTVTGGYVTRSISGVGEFSEYDAGLMHGIRLPGKAEIDQRIGEHGMSAATNAAEDARHQAALQLMNLWLDWLAATEADFINRQQIGIFERDVEAIERRVAIDDAATIDLEMARAALAEARSAAALSGGAASRARASLAAWFPDLPLPQNPVWLSAPEQAGDLAQLRDAVIANSHELALADDLALRAGALADRARADKTPDPQVGLRIFSERGGEETGFGITFSVPLGGAAREANAYELYASAAAARQQAQGVRRMITDTADTDLADATFQEQAWHAAKAALGDNERVVTRLRDGYALGAAELPELLVAERRYLESRRMEAEARTRTCYALLKLRIDAHELWLE